MQATGQNGQNVDGKHTGEPGDAASVGLDVATSLSLRRMNVHRIFSEIRWRSIVGRLGLQTSYFPGGPKAPVHPHRWSRRRRRLKRPEHAKNRRSMKKRKGEQRVNYKNQCLWWNRNEGREKYGQASVLAGLGDVFEVGVDTIRGLATV